MNITIEDVNDNVPVFAVNNVAVQVRENTTVSEALYIAHATDADSDRNGLVQYRIDDPSNTFFIESFSGKITLQRKLDYESQKQHIISVIAQDQGSPQAMSSTLTLTFFVQDVNDESPHFNKSQYSVEVRESATINHVLLYVKATDKDSGNNGRVYYKLKSNQNSDNIKTFGVFSNTGAIYNKVKLDHEKVKSYRLVVLAVDNGSPPKSAQTVVSVKVIDENDNDPKFLQDSYTFSIRENMRAGTQVGTVSAKDKDKTSLLQYYIDASLQTNFDGKDHRFFDVSSNGDISTKVPLDRESTAIHYFVLTVKDQQRNFRTATTQVTVIVEDENDNKPEFVTKNGMYVAHIYENKPVGTLVLQARVNDKDEGPNAVVRFGFDKPGEKSNLLTQNSFCLNRNVHNLTCMYKLHPLLLKFKAIPIRYKSSADPDCQNLSERVHLG